MIRLRSENISVTTLSHLSLVQQRIDSQPNFLERIAKAKAEWLVKSSSKPKKAAFKEIKNTLLTMCVGVEICNYCENNEATDIEHIFPKGLFPERAFLWENYLLACKTCNTHYKLDKFAVFEPALSDIDLKILRGSGQPPTDDALLINPRLEDPLQYFLLDIIGRTFVLVTRMDLTPRNQKRASYTLKLLGLNSRNILLKAREKAATYFVNRLNCYADVKEAVDMQSLLNAVRYPQLVDQGLPFAMEHNNIKVALQNDIMQCNHPTVWQ